MLNSDLQDLTPEDVFVTCFIGIINPHEGRLVWSSAGHLPSLLLPRAGQTKILQYPSKVLGVFSNDQSEVGYRDMVDRFGLACRLAVYSDGLTQAHAIDNENFGLDRLQAELEAMAHQSLEDIPDIISVKLDYSM